MDIIIRSAEHTTRCRIDAVLWYANGLMYACEAKAPGRMKQKRGNETIHGQSEPAEEPKRKYKHLRG